MIQLRAALDAHLRSDPLRVVDVGARGGWAQKWADLEPWVRMIGFEPDQEECARLQAATAANQLFIAAALYSTPGEVVLHHTRDPHCTSLYSPNRPLIERLRPGDRYMEVVRSEVVPVTTLDSALASIGLRAVDFIKIDTQGSELDVLQGGVDVLNAGVVGVEVEVEFLPLYEGQPLFHEVQRFMLEQGFSLMSFASIRTVADFQSNIPPRSCRSTRWNLGTMARRVAARRQILYADAIYLRDIEHLMDALYADVSNAHKTAVRSTLICFANGYFEHGLRLVSEAYQRGLISATLERDLVATGRMMSNQRFRRTVRRAVSHIGGRLLGRC